MNILKSEEHPLQERTNSGDTGVSNSRVLRIREVPQTSPDTRLSRTAFLVPLPENDSPASAFWPDLHPNSQSHLLCSQSLCARPSSRPLGAGLAPAIATPSCPAAPQQIQHPFAGIILPAATPAIVQDPPTAAPSPPLP